MKKKLWIRRFGIHKNMSRASYKVRFDKNLVHFQGNLCRCTGYRPIIEGYSVFAKGQIKSE